MIYLIYIKEMLIMSDYLKNLKQEMSDGTLPEHWQNFAEKMVDDRGWPYPNES